ncbi:MAG: hypothetical protein M3373_12500 [Gemmatimonadota bacterium]|nr:hypothetical protein [Gemmatimonadota bacterium]
MRSRILALAAIILSIGCVERSVEAYSTGPAGDALFGTLRVRVVDDRAGAVPTAGPGSRPTVTLIFSLELMSAAGSAITAGNSVAVQVPVDSSSSALLTVSDAVGVGRFDAVRLTLRSATLAVPGTLDVIDLLGGAQGIALTRLVSLDLGFGSLSTLVVDLNSGHWLRAVRDPSPGQPAYLFNGTTAFLDAIAIRTQ